jgi:hypothetical protein
MLHRRSTPALPSWPVGWAVIAATLVSACSGKAESPAKDEESPINHACSLGDCELIGERAPREAGPICPTSKPALGQPCAAEGVTCSYGDTAISYCREFVSCSHQAWTVPLWPQASCVSQPERFCPALPQPGGECVASSVGAFVPCEYPQGVLCYCAGNPFDVPGVTGNWECYGPPRNGACPETLPNLGDGCARSDQFCGYGIVQQACRAPYANVLCSHGAWENAGGVCTD